MLSAPPFVVVTIKFPLALVLKPYTSGEDTPVKFAPLTAGKVEGNLASGIVPDVKLLALKFAKSTVSKLGSAPLLARKNLPLLLDVPCSNLAKDIESSASFEPSMLAAVCKSAFTNSLSITLA